jgi:hypothetical protein
VAYTYTPTNLVQTAQENNVDGSGNVTPAVPSPTTFVYDNKKRRTETEFPNGVTQHVDYNSAGRQAPDPIQPGPGVSGLGVGSAGKRVLVASM